MTGYVDNRSFIPSNDETKLIWFPKMTTAQVVETSVPANNSPIQDYDHPDELLFTFFYAQYS